MADGVNANSGDGLGAKFQTDENGTLGHVGYIKPMFGGDGTFTHVSLTDGIPIQNETSGTLTVDGSSVTQPVSGTLTVDLGTNNDVTVTSGAITETNSTAILADTASIDTNVGTIAGAVAAGQMQVDIVADGAGLLTTAAHDAAFGTAGSADAQVRSIQGIASGTPVEVDLGSNNDVTVTSGTITVNALPTGTNTIGAVSNVPTTSGGLSMAKTVSAASTNATSTKASAGQVYAIQAFNVNAAVRYLKLYNKASAPTVGTDTPVKTLAIPGNTAAAGFVVSWPQGLAFGTGIAWALTTEITDAGTTGVAANELVVNIDYK